MNGELIGAGKPLESSTDLSFRREGAEHEVCMSVLTDRVPVFFLPWLCVGLWGVGLGGCAQGGAVDVDAGRTSIEAGTSDGSSCPMTCPGSFLCCAGACVDTQTSASHCGACDNACGIDETCGNGECSGGGCPEGACTGGTQCCGESCADVMTDRMNCGGCGRECAANQTCSGGTCTETTCTPSCGAGEACDSGVCRCGSGPSCSAGQACCDGTCQSLSTINHCGACGRTCTGTSPACCGGTCVDTDRDGSHCGECDNGCSNTSDGCTGGACTCGGGPACFVIPCFFGMCIVS